MSMIRVHAVISGVQGLPGLMSAYFTNASTVPTVAECNDATGRVRAFWVALAAQLATLGTFTVQQQLDQLDPVTGALLGRFAAASAPTAVVGSGGATMPFSSALGIRLNTTNIINRRLLQGRIFVSPMAVNAGNNGVPAAAAVTAGNAAGAALLTGATAVTSVVWHRPSPGGSNGLTGLVQTATTDPTKLWVLRSRRD